MADPLTIQLLGNSRIRSGDRVIPNDAWRLQKAAGIIKLLALEPGHRLHREQMFDALWPDLDATSAGNNLRYALHTARRILDTNGIPHRDGEFLTLGDSGAIQVDVHAFEVAADRAWRRNDLESCQAAVELYSGDLLEGDLYEDWLTARRAALRTTWLALLSRLARLYSEIDDPESAIATWQQVVTSEPLQEEAHAQLMLLYAGTGQRHEALAQFERMGVILRDELDSEPDELTRQLAQAIRDGTISGSRPPASPRSTGTTLPIQPTALIGRDREIAEVRQALSSARLLTITGPGGAGKTRLSLAVAEAERDLFPDGVLFVQLAPLNRPELIEAAILQAAGIPEAPLQSRTETLQAFFRQRSILLVLDNFEHLVAGASLLPPLLEASSRLKILVSSRVPLRLRGEREYPLRSLQEDASAELFIERSRDSVPTFNPRPDQRQVISEICELLDGLPLAIELAAARSRVLSPEALLERLEHPLTILTSGPRDLPARQQTLRDTIAWSYDLLEPELRAVFRALAAFRGGWSMDAAAAVAPTGIDPLEGVTSLLEHSLIQKQEGLEQRFRMLQTIREFGLEQLANDPDAAAVHKRHARYFAALVSNNMHIMYGPQQVRWLDIMEHDHANLRAALDWLLLNDVPTGVAMIGPLWRFWWTRGHVLTALHHYDGYLPHLERDDIEPVDLAHALMGAGLIAEEPLGSERSAVLLERARSVWLECATANDDACLSFSRLGHMALLKLEYDKAEFYFKEGLDFAVRHNLPFGRTGMNLDLADLAYAHGDFQRANELRSEALAFQRATTADASFMCFTLIGMAQTSTGIGRFEEASGWLDEALVLGREIKISYAVTMALTLRARVAIELQEFTIARDLLRELIANIHGAVWQEYWLTNGLELGAALLNLDDDKPVLAARLFAGIDAYRTKTSQRHLPTHQARYEQHVAAFQSRVDPDVWEQARLAGSMLTLDDMTQLVLRELATS